MPTYKEAFFPAHYRAAQVRQIMEAVTRLRSIAVYGLAGMGKSNLFRFLVAHPDVKRNHLGADAARYQFVFVDCNLCDAHRADAILEELDAQLERAGIRLPNDKRRAPNRSTRQAIRARLETVDPARVVVILLDPLDVTFDAVENNFWTYLRALRDVSGQVVLVLGARRPPPPLRELQELLTEACWVTPMSQEDAYDSLARDAKRLDTSFSEKTRARILDVTGGHPGLLKNTAELVARGQVNWNTRSELWIQELLTSEAVQEVCRDVWSDLEPEWNALRQIAAHAAPANVDARAVNFLQRAGIVKKETRGFEIFAPLFAAYVRAHIPRVAQIRVATNHRAEIETPHGTRTFQLRQGPFLLLRALAQQPEHTLTHAQLSRILYDGEPKYSAQALAAQMRRLRNALNAELRPALQDDAFDALLSERSHGYHLNLASPNGWTLEYHVTS